jgi:membrane-bound serine protease (ClpP class)
VRRLRGAFCLIALVALGAASLALRVQAESDAGVARKKSEAYRPQPSLHTGAADRSLAMSVPAGAKVLKVPIHGTIDLGVAAFLRRVLEDHADAAVIILDVNTLGGRVDAGIQMRDALLESKVRTVAFVHPRAISAGALIALSCDVIAVVKGASIGAATPIELGEDGAKPVEEKMVSYFRTEMRSTAEAKGRRGDIAEAMVDASVEIEGLDTSDKLLTLDTQSALAWKMADLEASSVADITKAFGIDAAHVVEERENWAEQVVRFLTDPVVSGLLMSLGTLGILIELYTPGLGIPGALGVLCLTLFFGGHLLVKLAGLEELLLFVVGLASLLIELFVIPGFGIAGITGLLCMFVALMLTLTGLPLDVALSSGAWMEPFGRVSIASLVTFIAMVVAARYLPRTRAGRALVLERATTRSEGFTSAPEQQRRLGQLGVAETDLRPSGLGRFGEERVDVVSEGDYVAKGVRIQVVEVAGARVVVRVISSGSSQSS